MTLTQKVSKMPRYIERLRPYGVLYEEPRKSMFFTACLGGFYTTAYVMEYLAREVGHGGFLCVILMMLNRVKVTTSSFKYMLKEDNFKETLTR